jgi:hypothetical protein
MPVFGNFFLIQFVDSFFYMLVTCQNFPVRCILIPLNTVAEYNSGYKFKEALTSKKWIELEVVIATTWYTALGSEV